MSHDRNKTTYTPGKEYVVVGKIIKLHGVRGEVKVLAYSGSAENFSSYHTVVIVDQRSGQLLSLTITRSRDLGKTAILQFDEITNREESAQLIGSKLWLHKSDFPQLASSEYYWFDLEGMDVWTDEGVQLGVVESIFNTKAHDILVVRGEGKEYLIPVRDEIIQDIDHELRRVVISSTAEFT